MFDLTDIEDVEAKLAGAGSNVAEMCRLAGIAQTTWGRWKRGKFHPSYRTQRKVTEAIREITEAAIENEATK